MTIASTTNRYDKYKDSGIEWIGEVPDSWGVRKIKSFSTICGRIGFKGYTIEDLVEPETQGAAIVLGGTNIMSEGYISFDKLTFLSEFKYLESPEIMLQGGEILITKVGAGTGDNAIYKRYSERVTINPNVMLCKPSSNINSVYLNYCLLSPLVKQEVFLESNKSGAQPAINQQFIKNLIVAYPSLDEQEAIAGYLDRKCVAIDETIEKQKSVIEKLKEYKQSIITQAVTKGLDKSAPMKDSGIEWIGQIPQHWEIIKFKNCISKIADIDHYMPNSVDNGYPYLMTGDLKEYASQINFDICKKISSEDYIDLATKIYPQKDDIIFARYATIGTLCYVDISKEFLVSYSCLTIRPLNAKVLGKFIFYYLKSDIFTNEIMQYVNSNTQSNIGLDSLKRILVILPNVIEQKQIISYLDKKCSEIDKTIEDKEKLIEKLVEYKKSLIYECVTGKRKVI